MLCLAQDSEDIRKISGYASIRKHQYEDMSHTRCSQNHSGAAFRLGSGRVGGQISEVSNHLWKSSAGPPGGEYR